MPDNLHRPWASVLALYVIFFALLGITWLWGSEKLQGYARLANGFPGGVFLNHHVHVGGFSAWLLTLGIGGTAEADEQQSVRSNPRCQK